MKLVIRGLNLCLAILVVAINVLLVVGESNAAGRIMGLDGGAIIIWLPIYLMMVTFSAYQMLPFTYNYEYINQGISPLFPAQAIANIGCAFAQAYQTDDNQWMDLIFVYLLFVVLGLMYLSTMAKCEQVDDHPYINYFFGRLWLSIYFAWVAGAVGTLTIGKFYTISFKAYVFAASLFGLLAVAAVVLLFINMDVGFGFTVVWMAGWITYFTSQPKITKSVVLPLFATSIVFGSIVFFFSICVMIRNISNAIQRESAKRNSHTWIADP